MDKQNFVQMVKDLLEYLTPRQLAKDLDVTKSSIIDWSQGQNLPEDQDDYYRMMQTHSIWDQI